MNCREAQPLLLTERDGTLSSEQRAALARHVAECADCRQLQSNLAAAMDAVRAEAASVPVPDIDAEWRAVQAKINSGKADQRRKRRLAPIIWMSAPLAAAAAVALAFFATRPIIPTTEPDGFTVAQADFVEVADSRATPIVFTDQESGWLVVWAADVSPSASAD